MQVQMNMKVAGVAIFESRCHVERSETVSMFVSSSGVSRMQVQMNMKKCLASPSSNPVVMLSEAKPLWPGSVGGALQLIRDSSLRSE